MKKTILGLLSGLLAASMLLTSCGETAKTTGDTTKNPAMTQAAAADKTAGSKGEKVLKIGSSYIYASNDPHKDWNGWELVKLGVGETLFTLDANYKLVGNLVESYMNVDPQTWVIQLKSGLKFSNGNPVTAKKVVASLQRTIELNPEAAALKGTEFQVEENEFSMKTPEANATALNALADPHFIICDVTDTSEIATKPICTGPYMIDKFEPEKSMELVPNKNYWNGTPKLSRIVNKAVGKSTTLGLAVESGDVDLAQVDTDTADRLSSNPDFTVTRTPSSRVYMIYANPTKLPDPKVREGLFRAINREEIAKDLLKGGIETIYSPFAPNLPFALKENESVGFDAAKSKALADETKAGGNKVALKFYERLNIPKIATQLQAQFTKAGWSVEAIQHENSKYLNKGDFDLGMYGMVTLRIGDPYDYLSSVFGTNGTANFNKYSNTEVDALLKQMKSEFDATKRDEMARKILKFALADNLHYYIGNVKIDLAYKKNVKNLDISPFEYRIVTVNTDIE